MTRMADEGRGTTGGTMCWYVSQLDSLSINQLRGVANAYTIRLLGVGSMRARDAMGALQGRPFGLL